MIVDLQEKMSIRKTFISPPLSQCLFEHSFVVACAVPYKQPVRQCPFVSQYEPKSPQRFLNQNFKENLCQTCSSNRRLSKLTEVSL